MCNESTRERGEKRAKNIFEEIMAENFLNLMKTINLHNQEAQQIPNMMTTKEFTPRHITVKKLKEKIILKATREGDS